MTMVLTTALGYTTEEAKKYVADKSNLAYKYAETLALPNSETVLKELEKVYVELRRGDIEKLKEEVK